MLTIGSPLPVDTQDKYVAALTLEQDTADTLSFVVANASAVMSLRAVARRGGAEIAWGNELLVNPQTSPPIKNVCGARFRSATPGTPAKVIAQLVGPEDPQIGGGTPFTQTLLASGQTKQVGAVSELAYGEQTASLVVSGTEAAPQDFITAPAVTLDGATKIRVEVSIPEVVTNAAAGGRVGVSLWDGGTNLGKLADCGIGVAGALVAPLVGARELTPAAGNHTYIARVWQVTGNGNANVGVGGAGVFLPATIRVSST